MMSEEVYAFPASYAQQRLWLLDQMEPGSPAYNVPLARRLRGKLNREALAAGLNAVVGRHEALRTTFATEEGQVVQMVHATAEIAVPLVDLGKLPPEAREAEVARLARDEAYRPFDLGTGPLLRATLLRLAPEEHVLLLTVHHIACDGWSLGILFREWAALYAAFSQGRESALPEVPLQYADYAVWQREWLEGGALEAQLSYWRERLGGELPQLELPRDLAPVTDVDAAEGARHRIALAPDVAARLRVLSRGEGATLFMALAAAFQVVLSRHAGQEEVLLGMPVAGRNRAETEGIIGLFLNTVVLRTDLSGNPTFRELLARVRESVLGALEHQDLPFEKLVEALQPARSGTRNPFFQAMINSFDATDLRLEFDGLEASPPAAINAPARVPLALYVTEQGEAVTLELAYQRALFDAERMACLLDQFHQVLAQVAAAPEQPLCALSLVTDATRALIPDPTEALDEPVYEPVAQQFLSWAKRVPEGVAMRQGDRAWTYRELAGSARALAEALRGAGLEPGEVVAITGPRSFGMVTAITGVALSGGVMLTLDPNLPLERRRVMLREANARFLLRIPEANGEPDALGELPDLRQWVLAAATGAILSGNEGGKRGELPRLQPDDPMYLFFTSGTTGVPKGVLGCHKGLSHFLQWQRETFAVGPEDRCAQLTGLSFDVLLRDVFLPLTSGGSICLPDGEMDPAEVLPWADRMGVTILHAVPARVQSWLAQVPEGVSLRRLRWAFFAGEPLADALVRRWRDAFPEAGRVVNLYGPTETTLIKCFQVLPDELPPGIQSAGRPLPHCQALVLGEGDRLCGIGELGEIVLRTPFRTLGYINAPEEARARFVPNPFREDPKDILYRTGDRGYYRPDGTLAVLGRMDDQVKIAGVRVEPGEVTAALLGHPAVDACAVLAHPDGEGGHFLAAYVVTGDAESATPAALRLHLSGMLPAAMIPSAFVFLDRLPLTPNGKVDRRALPVPTLGGEAEARPVVSPRTPVEETLAAIWAGVLGREEVGIHDDFFDLGGHSLLAVQAIARVRQAFDRKVTLSTLFQAPTVAAFAALLEGQGATAEVTDGDPVSSAPAASPADASLPLSSQQQRLWFLDQWQPGSTAYNMPIVLRLTGALDVEALRRGLDEIVRRHVVLRTAIRTEDGEPVQEITPALPIALPVADLRQMPAGEREAEVGRQVREEARIPFDLARGPFLRAALLRLDGEEHVLMLTLHHIAADGWSTGVLLRELGSLYVAFAQGEESPLPELSLQYADYARWQRERLQSGEMDASLSFWKQHLAGPLPTLELPTDHPRSDVPSTRAGVEVRVMPGSLLDRVNQLARAEGATLFTVLLAAWKVLLSRHSGQEDVLVGVPVANRTRPEWEGLIGCFSNTLALRSNLGGDPTFRRLLGQVRDTSFEAFEHQDTPLEKVIEAVNPERVSGLNPLFQVMFALQNAPLPRLDLPGLSLRVEPGAREAPKMDLVLTAFARAGELHCHLEYDAELFEAETVQRMLAQYQVLLEGIVAGPEGRLSQLPLLTEAERRQLEAWNHTAQEFPRGCCLHHLFERQVRRDPEAIALEFGEERLTYAELNRRANGLAHHLRRVGIGPDEIVGICMERSVEMVVSILGILKAGGAYLPLDPAYPTSRLAFMLGDAKPRVLLTQQSLVDTLPRTGGMRICLDGPVPIPDREEGPVSGVSSGHLAYIIYTSGSTGNPKGVLVEHRGVVNTIHALAEQFEVGPGCRMLQVASLSFDASVFEIATALTVGATLVLARREELLPGPDLNRLLREREITHSLMTPSALAVLPPDDLSKLRVLVAGGEASSAETVARWAPGRCFFNAYGPTETSIVATVARCAPGEGKPPIGRPLANTRVYLLDSHARQVPIGLPGEITIGGVGVARGYLNRPELNAERFLPDPFAGEAGARMYRTGDLGRYRPDGSIEYLGRLDDQVKIRGFRIELGEIEAALRAHDGVREAVALVREDTPGEKRLVAYVVPTGSEGDANVLRYALRERLPEYMVPSAFVFLETLPISPNGKVDRRALPAPGSTKTEASKPAPSRLTLEVTLQAQWAELLQREVVGAGESFFDLGGHSLLVAQAVARMREAFGVDVPLSVFFAEPTIAALAQYIGPRMPQEPQADGAIRPVPRQGPVPLSFMQESLWFLDRLQPQGSVYNVSLAARLVGKLDVAALSHSLETLAERHEGLRACFPAADGTPMQVLAPSVKVALPVTDLSRMPSAAREAEVRRLAAEDADRPFDLGEAPLWRCSLLRLGDEEHVLLLAIHHIITDGVSMGVFFRELEALYQARVEGKSAALPALPVQYADYAIWQRDRLQGTVLEEHLTFWKQQLEGAPRVLDLLTDHPRPAVRRFRGASVALDLPGGLCERLRALGRDEGATLFMCLLAAWDALLFRYTRQEEFLIGSPTANRPRRELEGLLGCFTNIVALRANLGGDPSFRELLRQVRATALDAFSHQELPFDLVVEQLGGERDMGRNPLFQVSFSLQDAWMLDLRLPGLSIGHLPAQVTTSKFDLSLTVSDQEEGLHCWIDYSTDLFEEETIQRMLANYRVLLEGIVADPEQRVSELPLLTDAERQRVLQKWNATQAEFPTERCVHHLIEAQVDARPEATAVEFASEALTYNELDRRANQLAHYLRRLGVEPDAPVGLYVERSLDLVVGMLGILKAGGAYLPMDPAYPRDRLARMVSDSRMPVLLTQAHLVENLPAEGAMGSAAPQVVCLDRDADAIRRESHERPRGGARANHLAYIIYTSGSTGVPKGVGLEHRSTVNMLTTPDRPPIGARDTVLAVMSQAFDMSVFEILSALMAGARLVVAPRDSAKDPDHVARLLDSRSVTWMTGTPTVWRMLVDAGWQGRAGLGMITGGEVLSRDLADALLSRGGQLWNIYGPTEITAYCTTCRVGKEETPIPIGRPIANTRIYLLDERRQPVPIGVAGEIYVGGAGVGRGYLNRPELTAERFLPDPFAGEAGARMYRTGDLGRYRPDGSIEYLGRLDDQVKLRGFRIELGEIEAVLREQAGVREAVALVREDTPGDKRLVAYVVPTGSEGDADALRAVLQERLPYYMVPSAFVFLNALPVTPNGKVDRRALPAPEPVLVVEEFAAGPRDELEERLARIWAKVLSVDTVGVHESFFDLGGHSLLSVRLMALIRKEFGKDLPLTALFQAPTVARFAVLLREEGCQPTGGLLASLQTGGSLPPLFCVHGALGHVAVFRELARELGADRPFYALQPRGLDGREAPHATVEEMAEAYLREVRAVQAHGPYYLAGYSFGGVVAFEMAHRLQREGEKIAALVLLDSPDPRYPRPQWVEPDAAAEVLSPKNGIGHVGYLAGAVVRRARRAWRQQIHEGKTLIKGATVACCKRVGRPLPRFAQSYHISRACLQAGDRYQPRPLAGKALLLWAEGHFPEPALSWKGLVSEVVLCQVPGNHWSMLEQPHVREVAEVLNSHLGVALGERHAA